MKWFSVFTRKYPARLQVNLMPRVQGREVCPTKITDRFIAEYVTGDDPVGYESDVYPAMPDREWPKWRRVITGTRTGWTVIYTHHELP